MCPTIKRESLSGTKPILPKLLLLFLIIFYVSFFLKPVNLTGIDGDLGRHLKSGELFFANLSPAATNRYSYAYPDHPVVDHHWGAGVIFYLVHARGGFTLLNLFSIGISLAAFLIFFAAARRDSDFKTALIVSLLLVPLIAQRNAVRPEIFSFLFTAIFYFILSGVSRPGISRKWLFLIPVIEIFWVNIHGYFLFGIFLAGAFLAEKIIDAFLGKDIKEIIPFGGTLILTIAAIFVNPFGIRMVTYPFTLFNKVAPLLVESGSMAEAPPGYLPYKIIFGIAAVLLILSFTDNVATRRRKFLFSEFIIMVTFGVLACMKIRVLPFFGFLCLPVLSANISALVGKKRIGPALKYLPFVLIVIFHAWQFKDNARLDVFNLGVKKGTFDSVGFFKEEKLKGPVFNNFKSGGLLIYSLFPGERVFIDQRLEAYPEKLHDKRNYLRESSWREWDGKYHFNVIFFAVPFKKSLEADFLTARLRDPEWMIVYADKTVLILVRDNAGNKDVIEKYRLVM